MRISDLALASGLSVATIKYYLREGLLAPGRPTAATQATYDQGHLLRLRLVRALVEVAGLSLADVAAVVACLEAPAASWHDVLGAAHGVLPPRLSPLDPDALLASPAWALMSSLGWRVQPGAPALAQLDRALAAAEAAGLSVGPDLLERYADAAQLLAEGDVASVPTTSAAAATRHVVVGTLLLEPVLLAMRRLAQVDASARRFAAEPAEPGRDATPRSRAARRRRQ